MEEPNLYYNGFNDYIKTIIESNNDKIKVLKTTLEIDFIKGFTDGICSEIYKLEYITTVLKSIKYSEIEDTISNLEYEIKISNKNGHIPCVSSKIAEFLELEAKTQICNIYKFIIK